MLCRKPIALASGLLVGCGQCLHCRINRRRVWTSRIMLESRMHQHQTFVTLTYNNESLPKNGTLNPTHLKNFLKRLRARLEQRTSRVLPRLSHGLPVSGSTGSYSSQISSSCEGYSLQCGVVPGSHSSCYSGGYRHEQGTNRTTESGIRFFAVGEYGEKTFRPHYHICLFGYPNCIYGGITVTSNPDCPCPNCALIKSCWGFGNVALGQITPDSVQYVAGYTLKKLTKKDDERLRINDTEFRHPEFTRMSLKPGIGATALPAFAHSYKSKGAMAHLSRTGDILPFYNVDGQHRPLGRYLTKKLRKEVLGHEKIEGKTISSRDYQVYLMYFTEALSDPTPSKHIKTFKQFTLDNAQNKMNSIEYVHELTNKVKKL